MNIVLRNAIPVCAFAIIMLGLLFVPALNDTAHAQCGVRICKVAPQLPVPESVDDFFYFPFTVSQGGQSSPAQAPANALCPGIGPFTGNNFEVVEDPFQGWTLDSVVCTESPEVRVTFIENGVSLDCLGDEIIDCTFTNFRSTSPIPALSEWGMVAAAGGLALVGVFFAARRRRAFSS